MTTSRAPSKIIPRAFPGISPGEVAELIKNSQLKNYPPETILCRENELEDTFYLILEGEVQVTKIIDNNEKRLLKTLQAGDFFGEMALIHNAPRAASVETLTPLIALEIHREAFDRVLKNSSSVSLAMVREISRRLRENDEMAIDDLKLRASELAEAYQKMAEMEVARRDFLTNVAHQLRTPLMAAGGYLQMIQKGAVSTEKLPDAIDTIARNVQQITTLVNDILFVQEMELILDQFEPVDMQAVARRVEKVYAERASAKRVQLRVREGLFVPPVLGDAQSLEHALSALVDNAVKFSPNGGKVDIHLRRRADEVAVEVSDQGLGIKPEILPRIFDRFYHLDKSGDQLFEGLGLGLAIAKQVVEQHKGRLEVVSASGRGSTFTMWLKTGKSNADGERNTTL